jgi:glucose/arabinose dehydrogenase
VPGNPTPQVFLDISSSVNTAGERGLLGMAFDPNFAANGRFYLDFIENAGTFDTKVRRYTMADPTANSAASAPFNTIITVPQPAASNHKAGWIGFRPGDANNLYIATGDGGGSNDTSNNAQTLTTNLGKILRVNVSGTGDGYTIPAGNPFAGATAGNDEIWAYGLRNPFRNSFDRSTGHFYIADVGQDTREEINVEEAPGIAGQNYGWRDREGKGDNPGVAGTTIPTGADDPVFDYLHSDGTGFSNGSAGSITGGYVYRGSKMPSVQGTYFFADWVSGKIGSLKYNDQTNTVTDVLQRTSELDPTGTNFGAFHIASFGEDGFGELYIVNITDGQIYQIIPEPGAAAALGLLTVCALRRTRRRGHLQ